MAVSVDYVVRETASNLWRNRLITIAAVLTVAVSLSLVGAALLLRQGSANAAGTLERGTQVTVWMEPTAERRRSLRSRPSCPAELRHPAVRLLERGANSSELTGCFRRMSATTQAEMPTSLVHPDALTDAAQVVHTFNGTAGVLR